MLSFSISDSGNRFCADEGKEAEGKGTLDVGLLNLQPRTSLQHGWGHRYSGDRVCGVCGVLFFIPRRTGTSGTWSPSQHQCQQTGCQLAVLPSPFTWEMLLVIP